MIKKFEKLDFLQEVILKSLDAESNQWFVEKIQMLSGNALPKDLHINFSLAPRKVGKELLKISSADKSNAARIHPAFQLNDWTVDAAARIAMIVAYDKGNEFEFIRAVRPLFETADRRELEILFAGISLLPYPIPLYPLALDSVRTNVTSAFNAMLYNNPYPSIYFDELNWNHLIMKAVFNNQILENVIGLEERKNKALANMAFDLLDERWASKRDISVYIWKLLSGYIDESRAECFIRVFDNGSMKHKYAALASLLEDNSNVSGEILASFNLLKDEYYLRSPDFLELNQWPYHS